MKRDGSKVKATTLKTIISGRLSPSRKENTPLALCGSAQDAELFVLRTYRPGSLTGDHQNLSSPCTHFDWTTCSLTRDARYVKTLPVFGLSDFLFYGGCRLNKCGADFETLLTKKQTAL